MLVAVYFRFVAVNLYSLVSPYHLLTLFLSSFVIFNPFVICRPRFCLLVILETMDSKKDNGVEAQKANNSTSNSHHYSSNGTNGNSSSTHSQSNIINGNPQPYQPPFATMGMAGPFPAPEMMGMVNHGLENALGLMPGVISMGPPPPGFMGLMSTMSPPVIHNPNNPMDNKILFGIEAVKKQKKHEKDVPVQTLGRASKRSRNNNDRSGSDKEKSQDEEEPIDLMTDSWKTIVLAKFSRCQSAEGISETSYFVNNSAGQIAAASSMMGKRQGWEMRHGPGVSAAVGNMSNISCLRKV